ncbi:pteridine-dependent deoxygenase [Xanthomonas albilineans]|uniref:Probable pteridine-dependent deoxygenase like protein n=1 Tax=Xanthomonas albilineans (strain GPE PC73 / CFBP 7063) TaxID=380358 RepID=D2U928_XANAP|nr:pteridine-dependent deoxygenase [Xanthomonas albilineans]QHQ26933.1 putative pteridine-dependent deoxygenase like protein [Xanthomonas albilineans]CBA14672.1 probable pteridine-dependent deoxygenase like protein [Xanthomonas albilineans GPE PC73]
MSPPYQQFQEHAQHHPQLQVEYIAETDPSQVLGEDKVLAVFGFGDAAPHHDDPRYLRVPLQPYGPRMLEIWRTDTPVRSGRAGAIAWASDGQLQFAAIEIDERALDLDIEKAATQAYAQISAFVAGSATPCLLRIWNHLDAITLGSGDRERYRRFCVGRARGLGDFDANRLPAATAVGRCDDAPVMQIYWLAAARAGTPLENPRQVSAYNYPRQYGPQPPSFARAMLPPVGSDMPLLLSGTASVVGHASMHRGQLLAQLEETFANFDALLGAARTHVPDLPAQFGDGTRLKVYVREKADLPLVAAALDARFGERIPRLLLHAVICRDELAVEIDGVHG